MSRIILYDALHISNFIYFCLMKSFAMGIALSTQSQYTTL